MGHVERVLPSRPPTSLEEYVDRGGGAGLRAARAVPPEAVVGEIEASGLRGRGGAGFPTGRKWRTVAVNRSSEESSTVVVNAAEGEPGSFKDRSILRANPYAVLEGALVAAHAVGADEVIVAMKKTFTTEAARVDAAITELERAGWSDGVDVSIFEGPSEYLYGEETALLESIDGRPPFPRIAPPFRHGVEEVVDSAAAVGSESSSAADVEMAGPGTETVAPPTLASNVETYANVPGIIVNGAAWFREVGTEASPGTLVCTVTGCTVRAGVAEMALGTPLREVIETIGGGARPGRRIVAVMSGVANALVPEAALDTPISYEAMAAAGSGLGAGGFIVFDDATDLAAVAAGVAWFLAVESCGQCRHCKQDGLELADLLAQVARSTAHEDALARIDVLLAQIADGARCNLASQQQSVVGSILRQWPDDVRTHVHAGAPAAEPELVVPVTRIDDGEAVFDEHELAKQPDWTYDAEYSGKWPADRLDDHRMHEEQL